MIYIGQSVKPRPVNTQPRPLDASGSEPSPRSPSPDGLRTRSTLFCPACPPSHFVHIGRLGRPYKRASAGLLRTTHAAITSSGVAATYSIRGGQNRPRCPWSPGAVQVDATLRRCGQQWQEKQQEHSRRDDSGQDCAHTWTRSGHTVLAGIGCAAEPALRRTGRAVEAGFSAR
jgi:hypothetical protein